MYHKIIIVGNLGKDPVMRYTPAGQAVCNFSVATNRRYSTSDGQQVDETVWFRASAWGKLAEVCNQYLAKGRKVLIEGRLKADPATGGPRVYQRNDGSHGASFEIVVQEIKFLSSRGDDNTYESAGDAPPAADDDIPF